MHGLTPTARKMPTSATSRLAPLPLAQRRVSARLRVRLRRPSSTRPSAATATCYRKNGRIRAAAAASSTSNPLSEVQGRLLSGGLLYARSTLFLLNRQDLLGRSYEKHSSRILLVLLHF